MPLHLLPILSSPPDWYFSDKDLQIRGQYEESDTHTTCGWKGMSELASHCEDLLHADSAIGNDRCG
jgi:uncharacterized protein (DUF427 family)